MRALGPAVLQVVNKIMGVILTALAVEMFVMGLVGLGLVAKTAPDSPTAAPSHHFAKAEAESSSRHKS
jgi:hypothetical protein